MCGIIYIMRFVNYHQSRSRVSQQGSGVADVLLKVAKVLGPSALKVLEGAAEGVGKKIGKLIEGKGTKLAGGAYDGQQGLSSQHDNIMVGYGSRLAGGSINLAGSQFKKKKNFSCP